MLTEIGVDRIVPWAAARCVGVWRGERAAKSLAKWRATARESGKQSRRSWLPEVTAMASTADVVALIGEVDLAVVLHEDATASLAALPVETAASILVVVGPEGGLTDEELADVRRRPRGAARSTGAAHLDGRCRRRRRAAVAHLTLGLRSRRGSSASSSWVSSGWASRRNASTRSAGISHGLSTAPSTRR